MGLKIHQHGVYTAFGDRNTLNDLVRYLKEYLATYDKSNSRCSGNQWSNRAGDIPHSLASIAKAKNVIGL
jgi:UDP-N-acetylglucosamine 4-epimerase